MRRQSNLFKTGALSILMAGAMIVAPSIASAITVPAGTDITVRLIDGVSADHTAPGERLRCSVDDPVVVGDRVVIPRGASCTVQVVNAETGGSLKGSDKLMFKLYDVTLHGRHYDVASSYEEIKTKGEGHKTARRTLGGAGAGALIGGLAGGGKGAGIGALIGGGVGTAASSGKKNLYVPPETRLRFDLRASLPVA